MRRTRTALIAGLAAIVVLTAVPVALAALHQGGGGSPILCTRNQLNVRSNGSDGAAGTIHGAWVFTNRSGDQCATHGYPDLQLYGRGGRPIPTTTKDSLSPGPTQVVLDPGDSATFHSSYTDVESGSQGCPIAAVLRVTPPHTNGSLLIPARLQACGGVVQVSAVEAGVHGP